MGGSSASKPKNPAIEERNDDEKLPLDGKWEFETAVDEVNIIFNLHSNHMSGSD